MASQTSTTEQTTGTTSTDGTSLVTVDRSSDGGVTSIEDAVVAKIAGMAAREVEGVSDLGGAISGALAGVVGRIRGDEHRTAGVGVEVGTKQAAVDLSLSIRYPASIPTVTDGVRENVVERIESLTGLDVVEVNIVVVDLDFPGEDRDDTSRVE